MVGIRRSAYVRQVAQLHSADLMALLDFLADVDVLDFEDPYPSAVVARVRDLVRCDDIVYQDCDLSAKRFLVVVGVGTNGELDDDDDEELYWSVGPCPISDFRARVGPGDVVTMSDVVERRRYHELPIYRDYFRPAGMDHVLDLGLPAAATRHRSFVLFRATGSGDFSHRDREVLGLLRPHLCRLEAHAALRRRLSAALDASVAGTDLVACADLTPREREIVELVAEGKTNGQIAAQLWVAPSTVKKHLENIYSKLGVGRRTAAATLLQSARAAVIH